MASAPTVGSAAQRENSELTVLVVVVIPLSLIEATVLVVLLLLYSVNLKLSILYSLTLCTVVSYAGFLVSKLNTVCDIIIK